MDSPARLPARLSPKTDQWFADWIPSKRPIQLPLPKLEYDSQLEIWEWKFRTLLKHNSLSAFIEHPGPSVPPVPRDEEQQEEISAATHCLALLGSCVSEEILADLLTLSTDNKLPEDPCRLFMDVKKHVTQAQSSWKQTNPGPWNIFIRRHRQPPTVAELLNDLLSVNDTPYKPDSFRNLILMTAIMVKRCFLFCPSDIVRKYITKATDSKVGLGKREWLDMRNELITAIEAVR